MVRIQRSWAGVAKTALRPPQIMSASDGMGSRTSAGQFASSQARVSARNVSRSDAGSLMGSSVTARPAAFVLKPSGSVVKSYPLRMIGRNAV